MREAILVLLSQFKDFSHVFGVNLLDIIIVVVLFFYAYEGYVLGFINASLDLSSFILSFIIALKFYNAVGLFLGDSFGISPGFARAGGFFVIALISEIILGLFFRRVAKKIPDAYYENSSRFLNKINNLFGIIPGITSAFIILSFLLSVIISLPSSPFLKEAVTSSRVGKVLVANASRFEKGLNDIFGGALSETMNFITVKPQSNETINLRFTVLDAFVAQEEEQEMIRLVNKERVTNGLDPLVEDVKLRDLARLYSDDMLRRGYFSHYNLEGQSPFERMDLAEIIYGYAGENLALAPSTELAMQGLMNSPGHRANILNANFAKVGVGVMDGGVYGKMFTQEFTD
jgi:uncharacterized protein YkwD